MSRFASLILVLFSVITGKPFEDSVIYPAWQDYDNHAQYIQADMRRVDITTSLIQSDIYQSFIENRLGNRRLARSAQQQVGDTLTFSVRNIFVQGQWYPVLSELIFDTSGVSIWIETRSKNLLLTDFELSTIIEEFRSYLFEKSGPYSVDSTEGILSIMSNYFGSPPDIDMDSKLDILLLDIHDTFASDGSYVAGFFDPNDLINSSTSNRRDLIYIDLYPSIKYEDEISVIRSVPTLAHEYQHLIHANYEGSEREYIFINEGLSELAEIVCGFPPRPPSNHFNYPNRALLSWNFSNPLPDYSRASLWTHYLFEQIGYEHISELVQSSSIGGNEYESLCRQYTGYSLDEFFVNWSIANLVNQSQIDTKYGYIHPLRHEFISPQRRIEDLLPAAGTKSLENLASFAILVPLVSQVQYQTLTPDIHVSSIVNYPSGVVRINSSAPVNSTLFLDQSLNGSITFLMTNLNRPNTEDDTTTSSGDYLVSGKKSGIPHTLSYDDGRPDVFYNNASYLLLENQEAIAIKFEFSEKIWLESISVNTIFLNELSGTGVSQFVPRDMLIQVAKDNAGVPGETIIEDHYHLFQRPMGNLKSEQIPLIDYYHELSDLKEPFFVILRNDSDDSNFFAIGLDSLANHSESHFFYQENESVSLSWSTLEDVSIGNSTLSGWNAMCRASVVPKVQYLSNLNLDTHFSHDYSNVTIEAFLPFPMDTVVSGIIVSMPSGKYFQPALRFDEQRFSANFPIEVGGEYSFSIHGVDKQRLVAIDTSFTWSIAVPTDFQVSQNFPNPFNGITTIPFIVFEAGRVKTIMYDLLGREVFRTKPKQVEPGLQTIQINPNHLSSGIYFARIIYSTKHDKITSQDIVKMTLVK